MKISDYITAEDWNALGRDKQLALRDGLRFMGHECEDIWFPSESVRQDVSVLLDNDSDLVSSFCTRNILGDKFTIQDIDQFIELASFRVS